MHLPADIDLRWMRHDPADQARLEALLSDEEQARLLGYTLEKRRREFVLGRAAARLLLAERLAVPPEVVPLRVVESGAVEVIGAELAVSIAHCDDFAVAAVAERRVGVDLERIAPRHPDLYRFLLHPEEYAHFEAVPLDATRRAILYWTLKEASLKALHTGFRLSPKKLRLTLEFEARQARVEVEDGPRLVSRFEERDDYFVAVAFDE